MRSLTVRLPDRIVVDIEAESRERNCAKSDVIRERLERGAGPTGGRSTRLNPIADLIGSVKVMLDAYREGKMDRLVMVHEQFVNTTRRLLLYFLVGWSVLRMPLLVKLSIDPEGPRVPRA